MVPFLNVVPPETCPERSEGSRRIWQRVVGGGNYIGEAFVTTERCGVASIAFTDKSRIKRLKFRDKGAFLLSFFSSMALGLAP
jgi:hypothetical protein